ncbi:MAG: phage major capsid protein [Lachnospiraceae bacterium]|nr:phage major capsid protein [Lachnospiraceae bacterium]
MNHAENKIYTGQPEYDRHFWNAARGRIRQEDKLLAGRISGLGSYSVPDAANTKFAELLTQESLFRQLSTTLTAYDTSYQIFAKYTDDLAEFVPEGGDIPIYEGISDFETLAVGRHKLAAFTKLSEEFVHDTAFNVENYLLSRFARVFGRAETDAFINGTGEDMPTGILCSSKGAETAVTTDSITYDDVITLYFSVKPEYRSRGIWMMNDTTALHIKTLKDDNGNYLWRESDDTILGRKVVISEFMPDMAAGALPVVFGDFNYYWVITRSPLSIRVLMEKFAAVGQVGYLGFEFIDGNLVRREAVKAIQVSAAETE